MLLELAAAGGGVTYMVRRQRRTTRLIDKLAPEREGDWGRLKQRTEIMSEEERAARKYFTQSSVMLGVGVVCLLTYPPLLYVMIPGVIYTNWPIYRDAWRDLKEKRKVTVIVVDVFLGILTVVYSAVNPSVLVIKIFGGWLYSVMLKVLTSSKSNAQDLLEHLVIKPPPSAWVVQDGVELEIPFAQVQTGDILIVNVGERVPVDGVVLESDIWLDEQLLTGDAEAVKRIPGDEVFAGSILQRGRLRLQVGKLGEDTALAKLRQRLEDNTKFAADIELRGKAMADRFALPGIVLGVLVYPIGGMNSLLAVLMMSPCYNMRLLGLLTVTDYLQEAVREGVLIKDGRVLEQVDKIDTLVFELSALQHENIPDAEMVEVISALHERGLNLWLVSSGDCESVNNLAQRLCIGHFMGEAGAQDKVKLVERLQAEGHCVGYVGDGIRDALPMKFAPVSISINGVSTLAHDTAKVILLDRSLSHLHNLFELAHRFETSMFRSLLTSTVPNAVGITASFAGSLGFLGSVGMFYAGLGLGLANVFWPKLRRQLPALGKADQQSRASVKYNSRIKGG